MLSHVLIQGKSVIFLGQGKTKEKTNHSASDSWNHLGTKQSITKTTNQYLFAKVSFEH